MKHVAIVAPEGAALSGIEMARHFFSEANEYLLSQEKKALFDVKLVGASREVKLNEGLFTILADATIEEANKVNLIVIPAVHIDIEQNLLYNVRLIKWIREQYGGGAEIASLCTGAFILAKTGLLEGKKCTTHWKAARIFNDMFPETILVKDKIITEEAGIYTSGGGLSMCNLLIHLIEKYAGRETAVYCAKFFQVDISRNAQLPFIIFQGQKDHSDDPVKKAQEFIENNFHQKITVDDLAGMLSMGRRSLERRFKKATANTPTEYIQRVKIEAAKKRLELSDNKINEIMYEVGYADTKSFRNSFKTLTGLLPAEYRSRYNKDMIA